MSPSRAGVHAGRMKPEKWVILATVASVAAIAVNRQWRRARQRFAESQPDADAAQERSSIDDVPTVQPAAASAAAIDALDERIAPAAPF